MTQFALRRAVAALAAPALFALSAAAASISEDFSADPFGTWTYGVGSNASNQFNWVSGAPSSYTGDPVGALAVHLDSSLPTVRLQRPLGVTLTDADDFTLAVRFRMNILSAPTNQTGQIAFGLVNSSLTGGDRTGSPTNFSSDNVFHTFDFNYFPNVSDWFGSTTGPGLTPTVFGAQKSGGDAFANISSIFGSGSDLLDNTVGVTSLPQNTLLEAIMSYHGLTRSVSLTMNQVLSNGTVTLITTEVPTMGLVPNGYDTNYPYALNTIAIMAYNDGWTTPSDPSLVADLTFESILLTTPIPEPGVSPLLGAATALALLAGARRLRAAA